MKCLLDTHTILWYLFADARLPKTAKDRLLISQAIENDLTIVTADSNIPLYDVKTAR